MRLTDQLSLRALACRGLARDLLGIGPKIRHDPHRLGRAVPELPTEGSE